VTKFPSPPENPLYYEESFQERAEKKPLIRMLLMHATVGMLSTFETGVKEQR